MTEVISLAPLASAPPHAPAFMRAHLWLYRASRGKFASRFGARRFLVLTTTGRKTGTRYAIPLEYHTDSQPPYTPYVIASNYGKDHPPAWYLNLLAHPAVEIEREGQRQRATAEIASVEDRQRLWPELIRVAPHYARYQQHITRQIPIVLLRPLG